MVACLKKFSISFYPVHSTPGTLYDESMNLQTLSPGNFSKAAGLYIHVPFCVKKCSYCAFYSVSSVSFIPDISSSHMIYSKKDTINTKKY
jgi:coproporphyrinogen III oxidase-like Fe-S oxidoreductase